MTQKKIAKGYERADSISHGQYVLADSAYRCQIGLTENETRRADSAEAALVPLQTERDRLAGRTWAGRLLRRGRNGLAGVGAATLLVITLKLLL